MISSTTITVNSHWWGKHIECEVVIARVTDRDVSYAAVDGPFAGRAAVEVPRRLPADAEEEEAALTDQL